MASPSPRLCRPMPMAIEQRQPELPRCAAARARRTRRRRSSSDERDQRADADQADAAEGLGAGAGELQALDRASTPRKPSRPTVSAIRNRIHRGPRPAAANGQPERCPGAPGSRPRRGRSAPAARRSRRRRPGVSAATVDLAPNDHAGRGDQGDLVGLALDPGVGDPHRAAAEAASSGGSTLAHPDVGVVDHHLGDAHRVRRRRCGPVSSISPGAQHRALDGDVLDRDAVARQARAGRRRQSAATSSPTRARGTRPSSHARPRPRPRGGGVGRGLGAHSTSKRPIQPSSANSVLWAWNMYCPGMRKRNSRMPRCALDLA